MENLSTPIPDRKRLMLEVNEIIYNGNEQISFKSNPTGSGSPFFVNISPINHNIKESRDIMSDEESNGLVIVDNDSVQDDRTSLEGIDSTNCEDYNLSKSKEGMSDHGSNEPNDIDSNYDRTSFRCTSSTNSEDIDTDSESYCSTEGNDLFSQEMDMQNINEAVTEMTQAVHKYIDKIKKLDISVQWELPKTLQPSKGIRKSEGLKGPLGPEEVSYIKKRLKKFCKEYGVNYGAMRTCLADKVSKFRFPNELRLKFIQYLCKDYVNDRNPLSVLCAVSKLGIRKGKYSEDEENFLIEMYHNYRGSYLHSVSGLLLNRHRKKILQKIERLKKKGLLGSRPSSNNVTEPFKLQNLILKDILVRRNYDVKLLKDRLNIRSWKAIGKEHNVSPALVKAIFICNIYPQIFAVHHVKFNRFFTKMLYCIRQSRWVTWEEVKWNRLSSLLYDVGPVFVYVMLRKIIMHCVPQEKWTSFRECVDYLDDHMLPYFGNGTEKVTLNKINIRA